jgi:hypothetical protein
MTQILEDFYEGGNNFGQTARLSAGHVSVGFARHEAQEVTDETFNINLETMPGVSYYEDLKVYQWYRQAGTGYRSVYYPEKGLLVDENGHYDRDRDFSDVEINVTKNPEEFFAEYISALNKVRNAAKAKRKAFAKETITDAKAAGFYRPKASISAMALALEWKRQELPRPKKRLVKKVAKYEGWQHIANILGDQYSQHQYSCKTTIEALALYSV